MAASFAGDTSDAQLEPDHSSAIQPRSRRQRLGRRWRWLFRVALLLACCYLLKPTRGWIDQAIVSRFDPNLSVQSLRWHTRPLVAELQHVDWQPQQTKHGLSATAERVWFAIDAESLLDARYVAPKVVLQNARFSVDIQPSHPDPLLRSWQKAMSSKFDELDWQDIPNRFEQQLGGSGEGENWQERLATWVTRSNAMAARADTQQRAALSIDNPLRVESEQERVLAELDTLASEHAELQKQFELLLQLLQAKAKQVDDQVSRELSAVAGIIDAQSTDYKFAETLAHRIVQATAALSWRELENSIKLGDALCQSHFGPAESAGVNYRLDGSWIDCLGIEAKAVLVQPLATKPLLLSGSYRREANAEQSSAPLSTWYIDLEAALPVRLLASNRVDDRQVTDIQVFSASTDTPVTAKSGFASTNRLVLASAREGISGQITLLPLDWQPLLAISSNEQLTLELSGNWNAVQFELNEPLPKWLIGAVAHLINEELLREQQLMDERIRTVATRRRNELKQLVTSVEMAATVGRQHYEQIVACEKSLRNYFADMEREYEFARRPAGTRR